MWLELHGREVDYSVMEFLSGTITLDSIWEALDDDQQTSLMDSVIDAVERIQKLEFQSKAAKAILEGTPYISTDASSSGGEASATTERPLGGPELGYFGEVQALLAGVVEPFTKEDNESLELEVLRELGYV